MYKNNEIAYFCEHCGRLLHNEEVYEEYDKKICPFCGKELIETLVKEESK